MARILISDDSAFMRMVLRRILTEHGHEIVAEAATGKEAVKFYKQFQPDLVTMDVTMPEMSGIEAVKLIHEENCLARIIMVTAVGQKEIVKVALMEGASDFVVKPFEEEQLVRIIEKALERERVKSDD